VAVTIYSSPQHADTHPCGMPTLVVGCRGHVGHIDADHDHAHREHVEHAVQAHDHACVVHTTCRGDHE